MEFLFDGLCLQNGRETNMDSLLLAERKISGTPVLLAVVCDGVGSLVDGAFASMESVRSLNAWFYELSDIFRAGLRLRDEVLSINSRILADSAALGVKTATTLSALLLVGNYYYVVHSGDSRVYAVNNDGLLSLTTDMVNESGKLTSCIGRFDNPELYYTEGVSDSDGFLLCSDGLYKRVDENIVFNNIDIDTRKSLSKTLNNLSDFAIGQGERDNISIAIIKIVK